MVICVESEREDGLDYLRPQPSAQDERRLRPFGSVIRTIHNRLHHSLSCLNNSLRLGNALFFSPSVWLYTDRACHGDCHLRHPLCCGYPQVCRSAHRRPTAATQAVAGSLTSGSAINVAARQISTTNTVPIASGDDARNLLQGGLPSGYSWAAGSGS